LGLRVGGVGGSSAFIYSDAWYQYSDGASSSPHKSFTIMGCAIGSNLNGNEGGSGSNDQTTTTSYYSPYNSACVEDDSDEAAYWPKMANCRRAQIVLQLFSNNKCSGTETKQITTTGVPYFLKKLKSLSISTILDNAISKFQYYESCESNGSGEYYMLSCSPYEVGHYVIGIFDDETCFNQVGVKDEMKEINNYMQKRSKSSNNYGYKNCQKLDASFTVYEQAYYNDGSGSGDGGTSYSYQSTKTDVFTYIDTIYASFGPVGALQSCNGFDAEQCADQEDISLKIKKFAASAIDTAKLGVAYTFFAASALVVIVSLDVIYKRRKLKTARRLGLEKKIMEERRKNKLQTGML